MKCNYPPAKFNTQFIDFIILSIPPAKPCVAGEDLCYSIRILIEDKTTFLFIGELCISLLSIDDDWKYFVDVLKV